MPQPIAKITIFIDIACRPKAVNASSSSRIAVIARPYGPRTIARIAKTVATARATAIARKVGVRAAPVIVLGIAVSPPGPPVMSRLRINWSRPS